jgi:hypothetical protein
MDHTLGIIGLVVIGGVAALYLRTGLRRPGHHGVGAPESPYASGGHVLGSADHHGADASHGGD